MYVKGVTMKMNDNKANPVQILLKGKKSKITWLLLEPEQ
jgi:hypothetical protein